MVPCKKTPNSKSAIESKKPFFYLLETQGPPQFWLGTEDGYENTLLSGVSKEIIESTKKGQCKIILWSANEGYDPFQFKIFDNIYEGFSSNMEMNIGSDLAKYLRRHTPGGSHWYLRLAMERLIFDVLQSMIDPKWNSKKRRKIQKTRKDQHTDFWWRPGDKQPDRPPSFF